MDTNGNKVVHDLDWAYKNATKPIKTSKDIEDCREALQILLESGKPTHLYYP